MPTTYALLAADLPAIQTVGTARLIGDALTDPAATFGAKTLPVGTTDKLCRLFNKNALELDYAHRVGSSIFGIIEGLSFTDDAAITLTVAAGKAFIDGNIELSVDTDVVLSDDATNYVWLKQNGTLEAVPDDITPPLLAACLLGVVIVASGAVVNYDLSGVFYHRGIPYRKTGDAAKPTDTPATTELFIHESVGSSFLWNGSKYLELSADLPHMILGYIATVGNGTTVETDLFTSSIGANTLLVNKDRICGSYAGTVANNANNKRLRVYFAGTVIFDTTALALQNVSWQIDFEIIRTGASTARAVARIVTGSALLVSSVTQTDLTGLDFTTSNILKITGLGGATDDIAAKMGSVDFRPLG